MRDVVVLSLKNILEVKALKRKQKAHYWFPTTIFSDC